MIQSLDDGTGSRTEVLVNACLVFLGYATDVGWIIIDLQRALPGHMEQGHVRSKVGEARLSNRMWLVDVQGLSILDIRYPASSHYVVHALGSTEIHRLQ